MKTQAISMQMTNNHAYNLSKNGSNNSFKGQTYVIVPSAPQGDSFTTWAAKNIITGSAFSIAWDLGTNLCAKFSKGVDAIPFKEMPKNALKVAGIFLLIGGIFRGVSHVLDNRRS